MNRTVLTLLAGSALLLGAGCGTVRWPGSAPAAITASGTLEAEETVIAPRVSGERSV